MQKGIWGKRAPVANNRFRAIDPIGPPILSDLTEGGGRTYVQKLRAVFGSALIGYWTENDKSGATAADSSGNGRDGTHTAVTLAQPGVGDGGTSVLYDGSTSLTNVFSAGLQSAFNGAEGTLAGWIEVTSAGVWTDGVARVPFAFWADVSNRIQIQRPTTSNQLSYFYIAGGVARSVIVAGQSFTNFAHIAITWSKSADQVKTYLNGVQQGATQTGLGVFAGSLSASASVIGAISTTPTNVWSGYLAHVILLNRAATAAEILAAATIGG